MLLITRRKHIKTDPYFGLVSLFLKADELVDGSTSFIDSSRYAHTLTAVGNAQIDTADSKSGGSILLDGTGDYLTVPSHGTFQFRTGDFTIEFWVKFNSVAAAANVWDSNFISAGNVLLQFSATTPYLSAYVGTGTPLTEGSAGTTGVWYHYAVVRSGSTLKIYRDGVETASGSNSNDINAAVTIAIGARQSNGTQPFNGLIDNFRITEGVARYTAAFTPQIFLPTSGPIYYNHWNPGDKSSDIVLSNSNLTATHAGTNGDMVRAILGKSSGKWYFEITLGTNPITSVYPHYIGLSQSGESLTGIVGSSATGYSISSAVGNKVTNGNHAAYGNSYTSNDVIMVAADLTAGKLWFGENGSWYASGNPAAGTGEAFSGLTGTKYPAWSCDPSSIGANPDPVVTANFGATAFAYTPPAGFEGWYN